MAGPPLNVLRVGPAESLKTPSAAARTARDGDTIEIVAGTYTDDFAIWRQNGLTIRGVGGRARLRAATAIPNGKAIWVVHGNDTTVENIEFSGARVPDQNGAGIRGEGIGLTVRNCYFHDNEDGILAGGGPASDIVIENTEFSANGHGDGYSHNLYIGSARSLVLRASYSHHARVGHNVKSRAQRTHILYSRIMDEHDGTSSYAIDLPNGGIAYVIGNLIQQGPRTENPRIVAYGAEGLKHPVNELFLVNNTIVNERPQGGTFVRVWGAPDRVDIVNNLFVGSGTVLHGRGELRSNVTTDRPGFVDRAHFDYRLTSASPAIGAGMPPTTVNGFSLVPVGEYVHPARERPRKNTGPIDIGAYEYHPE